MINSLSKTDDFLKMIDSLSKTDDFTKTHKNNNNNKYYSIITHKNITKNILFYKSYKFS